MKKSLVFTVTWLICSTQVIVITARMFKSGIEIEFFIFGGVHPHFRVGLLHPSKQ